MILPRHNSGSLRISSCRKSWGRCEAAPLNFANARIVPEVAGDAPCPRRRRQRPPRLRSILTCRHSCACSGLRRFSKGHYMRECARRNWALMINLRCKNPERSLSALGLGCSLIPGARWLCRRRMLRCLGLPRFTGISSTRDSDGAVRIWGATAGFFGRYGPLYGRAIFALRSAVPRIVKRNGRV
jgi:hypothetical protein